MIRHEWYTVKCSWGDTRAQLQYIHEGVYYWRSDRGFKFISHDLKDTVKL